MKTLNYFKPGLRALSVGGILFLTHTSSGGPAAISGNFCVDGNAAIGTEVSADALDPEPMDTTLKLKEGVVRLKFEDTSGDPNDPTNDWQFTFNDANAGGLDKFSIEDLDGGMTPFTIEAGARSNALYVEDSGEIGIGTSMPAADLHIKVGDGPTLRLEQDTSMGLPEQTWEVNGSERDFRVRDVSGGTVPFRIRPGAPTNAFVIAADGDIGLGTASPGGRLHVQRTGSVLAYLDSSDGKAVQLRLESDSASRKVVALNNSNGIQSQINLGDNGAFKFLGATNTDVRATISATGNFYAAGNITSGGVTVVPDYVFEPDYALMPIAEVAEYIQREKHLPNVPSAEEVEKHGLNMTEMQMKLLEKIEELTLYTIEQEKNIKEQQKSIAELKGRLEALEEG